MREDSGHVAAEETVQQRREGDAREDVPRHPPPGFQDEYERQQAEPEFVRLHERPPLHDGVVRDHEISDADAGKKRQEPVEP